MISAEEETKINTIITTRVDELLKTTEDKNRRAILTCIRDQKLVTDKVSSFFDYLIDFAVDSRLREHAVAMGPEPSEEMKEACRLLDCKPVQLVSSVKSLLENNDRLQRVHNQDRALLMRQSNMIESLQTKQ